MRIDIVTIFPDYLAPLELSLVGKARAAGLLDVRVHDLRTWTTDRHRTVDDAPYGGGAGMVMSPVPWGTAIDEVLADDRSEDRPDDRPVDDTGGVVLVVPTPAGRQLDQRLAAHLAGRRRLIVACGRYEGIDQRVAEHYRSRPETEVLELSIGDYVLNGGEVAALVLVEAVARLLPGVIGNPESLVEESHGDDGAALLEAPVFTRPATWRGLDVPAELLSGDHGRADSWRRRAALERTIAIRPDLLAPGGGPKLWGSPEQAPGPVTARAHDVGELLTLTRACWAAEALANDSVDIPPLWESLDELRGSLDEWTTWVLRIGGRLIGSVRARSPHDQPSVWEIGRLMVAPDLQGRGLGRRLLAHAEAAAPATATTFRLFTGAKSARNLVIYRAAGYRKTRTVTVSETLRIVQLDRIR